MESKFEILFLKEARLFLAHVEKPARFKILYTIEKAKILNDPTVFKKLTTEIWEFRTQYRGLQYRLLAFWDKTEHTKTLVIATHGFIKKTEKISAAEIVRANKWRKRYFKEREDES